MLQKQISFIFFKYYLLKITLNIILFKYINFKLSSKEDTNINLLENTNWKVISGGVVIANDHDPIA